MTDPIDPAHTTSLDISGLIQAAARGEPDSAEKLLPIVYGELRRLAALRLARERPGQTLDATGLVHEAYLRLIGKENEVVVWNHRGHFFAAASDAMRRIVIEAARNRRRLKRGGDLRRVALLDVASDEADRDSRLLELDEALKKLEIQDPRKAMVVKQRFFAGMTIDEIATALNVHTATVARDWAYARAWLKREMSRE